MGKALIKIPELHNNNYSFTKVLSQSIKVNRKQKKICSSFALKNNITLFQGDCMQLLKSIADNSISLIVTSPPYNIGKEYEKKVKINDYFNWQRDVIRECHRVLKNDGSICWQVGNYVDNGEVIPLDLLLYPIFIELKMKMRNRIIWHFGHGLHASKRFSGRYETILWFTKTDNYTFNLDSVRIPSKYPGKTYYKGPKKGYPSGNPKGKNPSDFWKIISQDWKKEVWEIPNVKANHPEKTIHTCQFPIELVERCILALSNENDRILDPYSGVGSSLIAGVMHNRKVIGVDKEPEYVNITKDRIKSYYFGKLKYRPLGKPIYQPTGKEKVARPPKEWKK